MVLCNGRPRFRSEEENLSTACLGSSLAIHYTVASNLVSLILISVCAGPCKFYVTFPFSRLGVVDLSIPAVLNILQNLLVLRVSINSRGNANAVLCGIEFQNAG